MVTGVEADTVLVVTVNVVPAEPAGTLTVAGTVAAALLLARETEAPPLGANMLSVTVPVAEAPEFTLVGLSVIKYRVGGPGPPPPPYPPPHEYTHSDKPTTVAGQASRGYRLEARPSVLIPRNAAIHTSRKVHGIHGNRGGEV